jgi:putative aldouronate transport system substrate-binding protein
MAFPTALALGLLVLSGANAQQMDPFGKYSDPVTINIGLSIQPTDKLPDGDSADNNQYTRYIKDKLNINTVISWMAATGNDYNQKVNLSIASGDLPDGLVTLDTAQLIQMAKADELADLTAAYNMYASPAMKAMISRNPKALSGVTFNGKIMAMPSLAVPDDGYHITWIRKDWLDKLGLKPPKTVAELEAVARAFIAKDPGGNGKGNTIGIAGQQNGANLYATFLNSTNNQFGLDPFFAGFDAYPGYWLKGKDGHAVYGSTTPETRAALLELQKLYKEGILDQEIGIRKDATESINSGRAGIYFGNWWSGYWPLPDAIKNHPEANWQAYAVPVDKNGKYIPHAGTVSNQYAVVRKGYEHPEALIKLLNLLIRDEGNFDQNNGSINWFPLRVPMAMIDESPVTIKAMHDVLANPSLIAKYQGPDYAMYKLLKTDVVGIGSTKLKPYDKSDIQYWNTSDKFWSRGYSYFTGNTAINSFAFDKVYSLVYYQTKTMIAQWSNLKKLEDETFLKIIYGTSISTFDQFVKDWKAQGGDTITQEVDAASK